MNGDFTKRAIKSKIPYLAFWMIISLFITSVNYDFTTHLIPQLIANFIFTGLTIPICYLQYYWLVPIYLYKRKFIKFILLTFLFILFGSVLNYFISIFIYHLLTGHAMFPSVRYVTGLIMTAVLISMIAAALGLLVKIISSRFQMEKQLYQTEKEKINTELNFLRSQVNPHFVFNILNTIYFQINKENTQARESVENLSEMLRYQLYDCITDKINIEAEREYLKKYVAMQTLRLEKGTDISFNCMDDCSGFYIAPLLLIPLIENAFKHISNYKNPQENKISITLSKEASYFIMDVTNTYESLTTINYISNAGGLGMQNLKRRLDLLYPDKYLLLVDKQEKEFKINLKIHYND